MRSRMMLLSGVAALCAMTGATSAAGLEFREEPYRVGIVDVGEPVMLDYAELTNEMKANMELRDWIESYGRPEYAEFQKVALSDPFLPYEIRLYYIEGRKYVTFGRVSVSPGLTDFGVRKYIGKLDSAMLQRLLTARPLEEAARMAAAEEVGLGYSPYRAPSQYDAVVVPAGAVAIETQEEVVEIVTPETVVVADEIDVQVEAADGSAVEVEEVTIEEVDAVQEAAPPAGADN